MIVSQTTEKVVKLAKATYLDPKDNKGKDGIIIVLLGTYNRVLMIIYFKSKPYNIIEH